MVGKVDLLPVLVYHGDVVAMNRHEIDEERILEVCQIFSRSLLSLLICIPRSLW